jgi:chromosome segregation ATPase
MIVRRYVFLLGVLCCTPLSPSQQLETALELKKSINNDLMPLSKDLQSEQKAVIYKTLDAVGKLYDVAKSLDEKHEKLNADYSKAKGALVTAHGALRKADDYMKKEPRISALIEMAEPVVPEKKVVTASAQEINFDGENESGNA